MNPRCTFIVSAYDRPKQLAGVLYSLAVQTEPFFQVIVADNAVDEAIQNKHRKAVKRMKDERFRYKHIGAKDCYTAGDRAVEFALGEYLCFPSDDDWFTPIFLKTLLDEGQDADLIYCDALYDPRWENAIPKHQPCPAACSQRPAWLSNAHGRYATVSVVPEYGSINKAGFIVRKRVWRGWQQDRPGETWGWDGVTIERMVKEWNVKAVKVPGIFWVHN